MNVTKLIGMLQAAGYDDSKAGAAALEKFDPIVFCELYMTATDDPVRANVALGGAVEQAVRAILKEGVFPEYRREDDRGLEESEYVEFVKAVLGKLVDQTAAEESLN